MKLDNAEKTLTDSKVNGLLHSKNDAATKIILIVMNHGKNQITLDLPFLKFKPSNGAPYIS